jgi:transcription-repair coupling factor (superfamily II helicase)
VEARGEFAVRGGIVDVFPTAGDHAVRVEFWGDEVESLRSFAVADQRSTGPVEEVIVDAARELVLDDDLRERARAAIATFPQLSTELEQLAEGRASKGVESLATLLTDRPALLVDFLPARGPSPGRPAAARGAGRQAARGGRGPGRHRLAYRSDGRVMLLPDDGRAGDGGSPGRVNCSIGVRSGSGGSRPFSSDGERAGRLEAAPWASFRGRHRHLEPTAPRVARDGHRVVVSVDADGPARRVADVLGEQGVPSVVTDHLDVAGSGARVEIAVSRLRTGFLAEEFELAVLGTWDVFGPRRRRASRRLGTRTTAADAVLQLDEGDAVVHRTHGVGRYRGMVTREFPGLDGRTAKRDYVLLEYADGDTLYVPSDQVDAIARYQGGETPRDEPRWRAVGTGEEPGAQGGP